MKKKSIAGVFCIEDASLNQKPPRLSALPVLQSLNSYSQIPTKYRSVDTALELEQTLHSWSRKFLRSHPILYLSFHGAPGVMFLDGWPLQLVEVASFVEGATDSIIYFAACSTFNASRDRLLDVLDTTDANLICGYQKTISGLEASVFETIALNEIARCHSDVSGESCPSKLNELLRYQATGLYRKLGFRLISA